MFYFTFQFYRRSPGFQRLMDRFKLQMPLFGIIFRQATLARWARTLSTMFAAGVPLVEALDSVAGACGNQIYKEATRKIQQEVSTGISLTTAMQGTSVFPVMMTQMTAIGEESGALDSMLEKVADFYENEVNNSVDSLASLMEPLLIIILGLMVGGMVVAMYLPIFKMASAV
jgi:type IV pilus assembly protein PilC